MEEKMTDEHVTEIVEPVDAEAFFLEWQASRERDPPAYTARMVPADAERWPIEAKRLGLSQADIERRIAEHRAGADQYNQLGIFLDHPGPGEAPIKEWYPLADGVALLLD